MDTRYKLVRLTNGRKSEWSRILDKCLNLCLSSRCGIAVRARRQSLANPRAIFASPDGSEGKSRKRRRYACEAIKRWLRLCMAFARDTASFEIMPGTTNNQPSGSSQARENSNDKKDVKRNLGVFTGDRS